MEVFSSLSPLLSGAAAGLSVDLTLYPIDTVKTRLQSENGFLKAGGFKRLYSGIGSVTLGSMPGAAVFFTGYESARHVLGIYFPCNKTTASVGVDMVAASFGEILGCLVRVPVEVVKQRAQVNTDLNSFKVFSKCIQEEGFYGLYRGYGSTVFREIPFSIIQFPLWEFLKTSLAKQQNNGSISTWQSAVCGFLSGGFAAALTTPLDVVKTRIMLAQKNDITAKLNIFHVLCNIWKNEGVSSLFAGIFPRVIHISVGGFIFLGMYDFTNSLLHSNKN